MKFNLTLPCCQTDWLQMPGCFSLWCLGRVQGWGLWLIFYWLAFCLFCIEEIFAWSIGRIKLSTNNLEVNLDANVLGIKVGVRKVAKCYSNIDVYNRFELLTVCEGNVQHNEHIAVHAEYCWLYQKILCKSMLYNDYFLNNLRPSYNQNNFWE